MDKKDTDRIDRLTETIQGFLNGKNPELIVLDDGEEDEIHQLSKYINALIEDVNSTFQSAVKLSEGDISKSIDGKLSISSSLKNLQATLRHLSWQAHQIAKGDFSQRTDFLGEFSESFNWMVGELAKNKAHLQEMVSEQTSELEEANDLLLEDITRREKTEDELRESENRFRMVINSSVDAMIAIDNKGLVTIFNPAAEKMFGIEQHKIIGQSVKKIIPHDLRNRHDEQSNKYFITGKSCGLIGKTIIVDALHSSGETFPVELSLSEGEYENHKFVLAIIRDIKDKLEAESQQLELRIKLERAERMESLGILAGGVAHDLNNMLGPMVAYPDFIMEQLESDSPHIVQLKRIGDSAKRAANVIQDLLTLARRGRYEMAPLNLNDVIYEYLDTPGFLNLSKEKTDIIFETKLEDNPGNISGSSPHLSKVIMNLIINAYDAMLDGGKLTVRTSQERIDVLKSGYSKIKPGDYIILSVKDTGMGIDSQDLEKIFEPYYSKKKMGTSGSGLGLSVVYGVVKDHNGYYDIISNVGEGTDFILYFPLSNDSVEPDLKEADNQSGNETILVVDDDEDQLEIASELLSSLGYTVVTAEHGSAAIKYLSDHSVDLVMLDMIMENNMDGLDTYREIVKIHPGQKAIIVSGYSLTDRVRKMRELGAGSYVKKPYTFQLLSDTIRKELDKQPANADS
jgi:two-component system, cell cycle sensor histidine kinase and response regulator CckA